MKFEIRESGFAWYIVRVSGTNADQLAVTNPIYFAGADYRKPPVDGRMCA